MSGGVGYTPSPSIVQSNATSELVGGRCVMADFSLLEQGDLVKHLGLSQYTVGYGVVVKIFPFRTHYDNRILVEWSGSGVRCIMNVHLLRKVSQ